MSDEEPVIDVALGVPIPGKLEPDKFCRGVPVGEPMPDARVSTTTGEARSLAQLWARESVLLVTGSITCPPSRRTAPAASTLVEPYPDLRAVVLYVIDAHPSGEANPYTGVEWVTEENRKEGILIPQPREQAERIRRAEEYRDLLGLESEVLVDAMENPAWEAMGRGPNTAILVGPGGTVLACQEWFDPAGMAEWLEKHLA